MTNPTPQSDIVLDERTDFSLTFRGTGSLPKKLTVYVYSMWEGINDPDLTTLDGIVLAVTKLIAGTDAQHRLTTIVRKDCIYDFLQYRTSCIPTGGS
ncbi:MAG: hypothetical protein IJX60_03355 [Paludibacteraceae bacterium]|nr:hypothetical protein [Paludibacteraceae bacterium]